MQGQTDRQNCDAQRAKELEAEVRALRRQIAEKNEVIDVFLRREWIPSSFISLWTRLREQWNAGFSR